MPPPWMSFLSSNLTPTGCRRRISKSWRRNSLRSCAMTSTGPWDGRAAVGQEGLARLRVGDFVTDSSMLAMIILFFYYAICRICTLFSASNRDVEKEQEDFAHMGGWSRAVIVRSGRFLSRVMLFVFGFYWIRETYGILEQPKDKSFLSKCLGCVYVQRELKSSDFKGVAGVVTERVREANQNTSAPMMMLFPGAPCDFSPMSIHKLHRSQRLPVYYPSQEEKDNPKLYAYNVRWLMAREGDLVMSDIGLAEKRVYHAALNGNNSLPSILHQKDD
ncbi:hypothetical protein GH714_015079 [Hevea brasiliensis]|uniref:Uncharacterized protein n=1 Tax=Hevea brasiliensis TaxID=3981 RepID=A0A6A6NHB1_HEVBR|nr:hypothetical protein GH714_015079 [Hevea brasiliensis]